jgi:fructose-bisphosphate aldolase class II
VEEVQKVIPHGVRKVNIDTDLRMAATGSVRRFLAEYPGEIDPRKWLAATTKAMKQIGMDRYEAFGAAGKASKIRPLSLESMIARYERGEFDPRVLPSARASTTRTAAIEVAS